jgi:hypothetical protein
LALVEPLPEAIQRQVREGKIGAQVAMKFLVPDRMLAAQLFQRGISLNVVENALVLAATRRLIRRTDAPPLGTVRSLAYFLPVIEEVLELRVNPDYFQYLRQKLQRFSQRR